MKVLVNSDKNITVDAAFNRTLRADVSRAIRRFRSELTRVDIHLSDVNARKSGRHDKRCLIEVRPAGHRPLAVTMRAGTVASAVTGALAKLRTALDSHFGKMTKTSPRVTGRVGMRRAPSAKAPSRRIDTAEPLVMRAGASGITEIDAATIEPASDRKAPKSKAIYQARRKSWPKR